MVQVFDRLREERPNALKRVKVIEANFAAQDLGISEENRELLRNEVNVCDDNSLTSELDTF